MRRRARGLGGGLVGALPASLEAAVVLAVFAATTAMCALYAYYIIFARFAPYDDEGYLTLSVKHFVQGLALYDDLYTQYGPFFYVFNLIAFKLAFVPVTHDTMRLLVVGLWLACAGLAAFFTLRVTGSFLLAAVVQVLVFLRIENLANEPGHPQGLSIVLVALLPAVAALYGTARRGAVCAALGVVVGCLLLTKINIGVFALLAVALVVSSAIPGRIASIGSILAGLAVIALPPVLMRLHIGHPWALHYALVVSASACCLVVLHWKGASVPRLRARDGVYAAGGAAAAVLAVSVVVLVHGTSPASLVDGAFLQALKFPSVFSIPSAAQAKGTAFALGGLATLVGFLVARRYRPDAWPVRVGLDVLRGGYGLCALYAAYGGDIRRLLNYALPFAWLAMFPNLRPGSVPKHGFARAVLVTVVVLNILQAYPVFGSQAAFATALLVPVAALCLSDALSSAAGFLPAWARGRWPRVAATGLAAVLLMPILGKNVTAARLHYDASVPLRLAGAERMRLSEQSVATYRWLAYNLRAYSDTFVGEPALDSLYLWTEKQPPTGVNPNAWMLLLDDAQQQKIVDALSRSPDACVVRSDPITKLFLRGQRIDDQPLVRYIRDEFRTVGQLWTYEFKVRNARSAPELLYCARRLPPTTGPDGPAAAPGAEWRVEMFLPAIAGRTVHRMAVASLAGQVFAETMGGASPGSLDVDLDVPRGDTKANLSRGLGLAVPRRFLLRFTPSAPVAADTLLVVRLFDEHGELFASVPFLDRPSP